MKKRGLTTCPECGGIIRPRGVPGRVTVYKNIPDLELPATLKIPTCEKCGSEWMNDDVAESIDRAMEPVFRAKLREMVVRSIEALSEVVTQGELERKLGMTQGYLTKLKNGHRDPSPEIALQLAMLARQPRKRLREIDDIWREAS